MAASSPPSRIWCRRRRTTGTTAGSRPKAIPSLQKFTERRANSPGGVALCPTEPGAATIESRRPPVERGAPIRAPPPGGFAMKRHPILGLAGMLCAFCLLLPGSLFAAPITTSASGVVASDIQATVDAFRTAVGNPNNGNNPGAGSGRREINWDGAGATTPTVSGTPLTAFTNTRGATMTTPGTGFIQGSPAALATQFSNASYSTTFAAFSLER